MTLLKDILEEFKSIDNQRERLQFMIALGEELQPLDQAHKTETNKVQGCMSEVYIHITKKEDKIHIQGWADSLIVKGYVYILITILNNKTKQDILNAQDQIKEFIKQANLNVSLVPSRANAFANIYEHIKKNIAE